MSNNENFALFIILVISIMVNVLFCISTSNYYDKEQRIEKILNENCCKLKTLDGKCAVYSFNGKNFNEKLVEIKGDLKTLW